MADTTAVRARPRQIDPTAGDRVIFERADGLYDVENVIEQTKPPLTEEDGIIEFDRGQNDPDHPLVLQKAKRPPLKSRKEAYEIALGHMNKSGGLLWFRHHANPDSVDERFFLRA